MSPIRSQHKNTTTDYSMILNESFEMCGFPEDRRVVKKKKNKKMLTKLSWSRYCEGTICETSPSKCPSNVYPRPRVRKRSRKRRKGERLNLLSRHQFLWRNDFGKTRYYTLLHSILVTQPWEG